MPSAAERNKTIVRRLNDEYVVKGNTAAADELWAAEYEEFAIPGGPGPKDRDAHHQGQAELRTAFPDLRSEVVEQLAQGELVATRFVMYGTHKGRFAGRAPTGKEVSWEGMSMHRIKNGRVVEARIIFDSLDLMKQLGGN